KVTFDLKFSTHKYPDFTRLEAAREKGTLELTEIDITRPFPATLTGKADGLEVKVQWFDEKSDPRLLERPTGVDLPATAVPVPSITADGKHGFVRDGNDLVVVDAEKRWLKLPLTGIDLFPDGKEHQTVVVSTGPIDLGRENKFPLHITVRHNGEEKTILWSDPGVPAVVRHGRP
ncbi:MAG TPA: hypothetical protein VD866_04845, partial [Urbifossiella sp.]|nr:hypothetical protein [Urbifossiella sp.]